MRAMKKFGLIGGTSWRSTRDYYSAINEAVNDFHGNNTNPPLVIANMNQKEIHDLQRADRWDEIADRFIDAAASLRRAGIEGLAMCANTPHKIFEPLQASLDIPVLHIADSMAKPISDGGWKTIGLIGTRFTMGEPFITERLERIHGVNIRVPSPGLQEEIQQRIYGDLSVGGFHQTHRDFILGVCDGFAEEGAGAVILGCTELPLLLEGTSASVPLINPLRTHCEAIVRFILDPP